MSRKILVVEDDEILRHCFDAMLRSDGCEVYLAADGVDAVLMLLEGGEDGFDFILMDYLMPRLGGFDAMRIMKKIAPDLPFIIMTGHPLYLEELEFRIKGYEGVWCVSKPVDSETIMNTVRSVV